MTIDFSKFDVILDADDPNFIEDLMEALGVGPGEKPNFIFPQFSRTDGRVVTYLPSTPEEYAALPRMSPENLKKIGCQIWDEENGQTHWLYPAEWYDMIPDGTEVVDIFGKPERFQKGVTDDDRRFGALSFGFLKPTAPEADDRTNDSTDSTGA